MDEVIAVPSIDWRDAKKLWARSRSDCGDPATWLRYQGVIALGFKQFDAAVESLERAHREAPNNDDIAVEYFAARVYAGVQHTNDGSSSGPADVDASVVELERIAERLPQNTAVLEHLGMAYVFQGRLKDAIAVSSRAIAIDPALWIPRRTLVVALEKEQRYLEASKQVTATAKRHEAVLSDIDFMVAAARSYLKSGKPALADATLQALVVRRVDAMSDSEVRQLRLETDQALSSAKQQQR